MSIYAQQLLMQISGNNSNAQFKITSIPGATDGNMFFVFAHVCNSLNAYYGEYQKVIQEQNALNTQRAALQDPTDPVVNVYQAAKAQLENPMTNLGKRHAELQAQVQDLNKGSSGKVELVSLFFEKGSTRISEMYKAKVHSVIPLSPFQSLAELLFASGTQEFREAHISSPLGIFGKNGFELTIRESNTAAVPAVTAIKVKFDDCPQDMVKVFVKFTEACEGANPPITMQEEAKALDALFFQAFKHQVEIYQRAKTAYEALPHNAPGRESNRIAVANSLENIWQLMDKWQNLWAVLDPNSPERNGMVNLGKMFNPGALTERYPDSRTMHAAMIQTPVLGGAGAPDEPELRKLIDSITPPNGRSSSASVLAAMQKEITRMRPTMRV